MNKKSINFSRLAVIAAMSLYLFGFSVASQAEEAIARVIVSSGHFSAIQLDGKERVLKRRSAIFEGDTLVTSEDGRAQIRFKDGALIDIQAATQLRLDEYNYQGQVDGSEKNTMSLIKGGFRTITGVVGKKNKKNYKVNTPVATIGIRGTHYGLHYCGSDCGVDTGNGQYQNKTGLYGGVVDGAVVANNDSGEIHLGNDEYFHVASKSAEPQVLLVPPAIIFKGGNEQVVQQEATQTTETVTTEEVAVPDTYDVAYSDPDTGTVTTSFQEPTQPVLEVVTQEPVGDTSPTQLLDKTTLDTWSSTGYTGGIAFNETGTNKKGTSTLFGTETSVAVDANGDPVSFYYVDPDQSKTDSCNPCTFDVNDGAGNAVGKGTDATTGTTWGRWDTGNYVITENGKTVTTDGSFYFIYSNNITSDSRLSELAATYGNAKLYKSLNTGGVLLASDKGGAMTGSMEITANFVSQAFTKVSYSLTGSGSESWTGTMEKDENFNEIAVSFTDALSTNGGISLQGDCNGGTDCSTVILTKGQLGSTFVGSNAEGVMGTFSIQDDAETITASGVTLMTE